MQNKTKIVIIVLTLISIISTSIAGILGYQIYTGIKTKSETEIDKTWLTYHDEELGLEVKYPLG